MNKVSVIIPVYNAEQFLNECLLSVTGQSYKEIEIICIDDGSKDNSRAICEEWVKKDDRVHYFYQGNQGVSAARNKGLDLSTGDYVCFVDADDCIHNLFIETLLSYCDENTVICSITRKEDLGLGNKTSSMPKIKFIKDVVFERIRHPGFTCFLYNKKVINVHHLRFHEGCIINEDYEFYIKYLTFSSENVILLDYKGYYYRENNSSAMSAPISQKKLTSIDATERINMFLFHHKIINDDLILLSNSILTYVFGVSRRGRRDMFDYIHSKYDVRKSMKKMLSFPKIGKKLLALFYLSVGPDLFYKIVIIVSRTFRKGVYIE